MTPGLIKSYTAGAAITKSRIVKFDAADNTVIQAAAAADASIGIAEQIDAAQGESVDVVKSRIAYLELGGAVARGEPVTSDATGRGVAAAPAAGANVRVIGFAELSGVVGDIVPVFINPHTMQGA